MTTQLTVMPAMELRNVLNIALAWVRQIEAKFDARERGREWSSGAMKFILIFFGGCALLPVFFGILFWSVFPGEESAPIAIPFILIGVGCIPLGIILLKKSRAKNKAIVQKADEEIAQLLQDAKVLQILPDDYCSSLALEYMIEQLDKGRATTWRECADKYEEQVHRWTLETNSAEAARYAKSAASAARWAAIGAWRR